MTMPAMNRQQIDEAADMEWTKQPAAIVVTIHAVIEGFSVEVRTTLDQVRLATRKLRDLNAQSIVTPPPARKAAERAEPAYDGSGQPMCPIHHKPLQEGRYGLYCPSKATGEHANPKGYCNVRF